MKQIVAHPTWEQIDNCRKDELRIIADNFKISVSKQLLKKELKAQLVGKLVELRVLDMPAPVPEIAVKDRGTLSEAVGGSSRAAVAMTLFPLLQRDITMRPV